MSQQNQASFLLQAIGENYIMKTYAKGERKKKLPVVILSVALGKVIAILIQFANNWVKK